VFVAYNQLASGYKHTTLECKLIVPQNFIVRL
jgi:hypothetical protein